MRYWLDVDSTYMCELCLPTLDGWVEVWPCRAMADTTHAMQNMKSFATQAVYGQGVTGVSKWREFLPLIGKVNAVMTGKEGYGSFSPVASRLLRFLSRWRRALSAPYWPKIKKNILQHPVGLVSNAHKSPHFRCIQGFSIPIPESTGIARAGLRNQVVFVFICSGERRP